MIEPEVLYHGSNVGVQSPRLRYSRKELDFGAGFYTTTDFDQAERWARRVTKVRRRGEAIVTAYDVDHVAWPRLSALCFESADAGWLRLVAEYRTGGTPAEDYDVIAGPVADDRTIDVISQYVAGTYDEATALRLLLPMRFRDQWVLKTEAAVSAITTRELIHL